jgi:branched-chain amino acid transport system substrate-binding protein
MQQGKRHSSDHRQPTPLPRWIYAVSAMAVVLLGVSGWLIFGGSGDEPGGAVARGPTITIGAMYPQDTNSEESDDVLRGERFAVEYINSRADLKLPSPALPGGAGLLGARLKLVPRDSGDRCHAEATFDRLVDHDNAVAVLGAYESTITLRAILAADRRRVPLLSESASAPSLTDPPSTPGKPLRGCAKPRTDPRPSDWFFRVGPSDRETAGRFLSLFAASRTPTYEKPKVAILHESNDIFGNSTARVTETLAKKRGMTARQFKYHAVIGSHARSPCARLQTLVGEIADYRPDVVFAASYSLDAIAVVQTMKQQRYTPPALLTFGAGFLIKSFVAGVAKRSPLCLRLPTADAAGIVSRSSWSRRIALDNPAARPIVEAYEKRFGPMNSRSAAGFTTMLTVAQAIRDAGSSQPDRIRDALQRLDLPSAATIMPWRGVRFDASGQNTRAEFMVQQVIDGRYVDVYPHDLAARPVIWPLALARK